MRNLFSSAVMATLALAGSGCGGRRYPTHPPTMNVVTDGGAVSVTGGFNRCPSALVQLTPEMARVGGTIAVQGSGSDPDGTPVTFSWKATSGELADAKSASTTFTCVKAGPVTITLTVSDGTCAVEQANASYCLGTPGTADGGADAGGGGAAGAGGAGGGGGAGGTTGGGGATGGGGTGGPPVTNSCPGAEPTSGGKMCPQCTIDNCSLGNSAAATDGCCGLGSAADQLLCVAAFSCFAAHATSCTTAGDPTNCFCGPKGGAASGDCYRVPGAANGPCTAEVMAAAKTADLATIKSLFVSPASPLGRAVNLTACMGAFCTAECAIP